LLQPLFYGGVQLFAEVDSTTELFLSLTEKGL
jgi:hypothetical protein